MANYVLQELSEEMTDGKKIVYPKMQSYSLHDYDTVVKHIHEYGGSFSEGTIRGVIKTLVEVLERWMPLGHTIKIDGLGVFSLSLGFDTSMPSERLQADGSDEAKDGKESTAASPKTKYRHVCIKSINFKPDPQLLQTMNLEANFERVKSNVKVPRKNKYNHEERLAKAKEIIGRQGFMTLSDYAKATGQCRSVASNDLKRMVADVNSGITTRGSHSHKVWTADTQE